MKYIFLIILQSSILNADTNGFKLADSTCKLMGNSPSDKQIKIKDGSLSKAECSISGKKVTCIIKYADSDKIFGSESYNIIVNSPEFLAFKSEAGNVSYAIDINSKTYIHAQYSYNETSAGFISKSCIGKYLK